MSRIINSTQKANIMGRSGSVMRAGQFVHHGAIGGGIGDTTLKAIAGWTGLQNCIVPDLLFDFSLLPGADLAEIDSITSTGADTSIVLTSPASPAKPTILDNAQNGLRGIQFTGVDSEYFSGAYSQPLSAFSYYMVVRSDSHLSNAGLWSIGGASTNDWNDANGMVLCANDNVADSLVTRHEGNPDIFNAQQPISLATWYLLEVHVDTLNKTATSMINGGSVITQPYDPIESSIDPTGMVMGSRWLTGAPSVFGSWSVGEAQIFNNILSEANKITVRTQLMSKWGL